MEVTMGDPRWWGWGTQDVTYSLDDRPRFLSFLAVALGLTGQERGSVAAMADVVLPPSRLPEVALDALIQVAGAGAVSTGHDDRLRHANGKSYRDLVRLRAGRVERAPDAVVWPDSEEAVLAVLRLATRRGFSVVPFGGGSSVTGGVEALGDRPVVCLDMARMDRLLALDELSGVATIQAGIRGPALEAALGARGYTLGHFPQSWEFSSLGGWIATRSAGQQSAGYGKIEAMVVSLTVATPAGVVQTRLEPAAATGPCLRELLVGSEGILGVITQASLRVRTVPARRDYRGVAFRGFADGLAAVREIAQSGLQPVMVRLSDPAETQASLAMQRRHGGLGATLQSLGKEAIARIGYDLRGGPPGSYDEGPCLLILGCEGQAGEVGRTRAACTGICRRHGGLDLGSGVGAQWYAERFALPYLRDVLLDRGVMTDTLETATVWSNVAALHQRVAAALRQAGAPFVMCHVSHMYRTGASLYFTFLARQEAGAEIEQWQALKKAATDAIMDGGGALSHHHGIGYEHAAWMVQEHGALGVEALRSMKKALDPEGVMNPGKLLPGG
jgi:alkyldihydroxyacetonephosphate synthase